jgi:hypothetical protein
MSLNQQDIFTQLGLPRPGGASPAPPAAPSSQAQGDIFSQLGLPAPNQQVSPALTPKPPVAPAVPLWKKILGGIEQGGEAVNQFVNTAMGGVTPQESGGIATSALKQKLSPSQRAYYQKVLAQSQKPLSPGAQAVAGSPLASGAARVLGSVVPILGIGMEAAGTGIEALKGMKGSVPTAEDAATPSEVPQTPQIAPGAEQPPSQVEAPAQATNAAPAAPFNPVLQPGDAEKIATPTQPTMDSYQNYQDQIDAYENNLTQKYGEAEVNRVPVKLSKPGSAFADIEQGILSKTKLSPDEVKNLQGLYAQRDTVGDKIDASTLKTVLQRIPDKGPANRSDVEAAVNDVQKKFNLWTATGSINEGSMKNTGENIASDIYSSLAQRLGYEGGYGADGKLQTWSLTEAMDEAKRGNVDPLLPQVQGIVKAIFQPEGSEVPPAQPALVGGEQAQAQAQPPETPALDQAGKPTQSVGADLYRARFVDETPFDAKINPDDPQSKASLKDIQAEFTGRLNRDKAEGYLLQRDINKLIPDQIERDAAYVYVDKGGNMDAIREVAADQDPSLDQKVEGRDYTIRDAYIKALNLSQGAQDAVKELAQPYYDEAGKYAMETGATKDVRDNYANRIWEKRETGGAYVQPRWMDTVKGIKMVDEMKDIIRSKDRFSRADKSEIEDIFKKYKIPKKNWSQRFADIKNTMFNENQLTPTDSTAKLKTPYEQKGMTPFTSHAKPRVFPTLDLGIKNGFLPSTMDLGELMRTHAGEMSRANNMRLLGDFLVKKAGAETISNDAVTSQDWKTVMSFGNKRIVAPTRLADAMKVLTEVSQPGDVQKGVMKVQGRIKTGITSFSAFHLWNLFKSELGSSKGGFDLVAHAGDIGKILGSQEMKDNLLLKWTRAGQMDTHIDTDIDVMDELTKGDDFLSKVSRLPVIKQFFNVSEGIRDFTFQGVQSHIKLIDSELKLIDWQGKHPNATQEDTTQAMRSIARFQNSAQGGMNWGALGVSPTVKNALNLAILSPDWCAAKFMQYKYAFTDSGLTGSLSRQRLGSALVAGAILNEGLSLVATGHFTDQNPSHKMGAVEIAANTFFDFFPADVDDALTIVNDIRQKGLGYAAVQELISKAAPIPSTLFDLYYKETSNKQGPVKGTVSAAETAAEDLTPIPIGAAGNINLKQLVSTGKGNTGQSWLSRLAVGAGVAKYSPPAKGQESTGIGQQAQSQLQQLRAAGKSKAPSAQALAEANLSPLAKSYLGLSAPKRTQFMASLSPDQQSLLQQELSTYKAPAKKSKSGLTGFKGISGMKGLKKL